MSLFVDFHRHGYRTAAAGTLYVQSYRAGVDGLPATRDEMFSLGIHPWDAGKVDMSATLGFMAEVAPAAIGEIGLDRVCGVDMDVQVEVFRRQLELAVALHRPVVIHSVRTLDMVADILSEYPELGNVAFHGYIGDTGHALKLASAGYYLSFGHGVFRSPKTLAALSAAGAGCLLFETDGRDMPVSDVYARAAQVRTVDVYRLKDIVFDNYRRFFDI